MVKVAVLGGDGLIGSACLRIQTVAASDVAEAVVLADGFSCRKQVSDLTVMQAMTLAELLAAHLAPLATPASSG